MVSSIGVFFNLNFIPSPLSTCNRCFINNDMKNKKNIRPIVLLRKFLEFQNHSLVVLCCLNNTMFPELILQEILRTFSSTKLLKYSPQKTPIASKGLRLVQLFKRCCCCWAYDASIWTKLLIKNCCFLFH